MQPQIPERLKKGNMAFKTSNTHSKDGKDFLALFLSRNISKCIVKEHRTQSPLFPVRNFR